MTASLPRDAEDEPSEIVDPASDGESIVQTAEDIFGGEDNARAVVELLARFVAAWERHKREKAPEVWLADEMRRYPSMWSDEEEILSTAREIVTAVEQADAYKESLYAHLDAGKSKVSWLARTIERGAAAAGTVEVGGYAAKIDEALEHANSAMLKAVRSQSGDVSKNPNLDGFIAEQHHANTFNLDAVAKNSPLRAEVLGSASKNSMDIGVYDNKSLVGRYQSKFGKNAEATEKLFEKGNYRGQQKLVPSEQKSVRGSTDRLERDGVRSEPLSKDEAEAMRERAQRDGQARRYDWNDVNRIEIAKSIGKQALLSAALAIGFQGARLLARRVWNSLRGERNPHASEDLKEFFASSIKSGGHVGVRVAVGGAVVIAAKNGWIPLLQATPPGRIANIVYVAMENARVLFKFAKGELSGEEALDAIGNCTCGAVGGLVGAAKGAALGFLALGPIGAFVGGVVGAMAGDAIGKAVYEGGKAIVKTATRVARTVIEEAVRTAATLGRRLNPLELFA